MDYQPGFTLTSGNIASVVVISGVSAQGVPLLNTGYAPNYERRASSAHEAGVLYFTENQNTAKEEANGAGFYHYVRYSGNAVFIDSLPGTDHQAFIGEGYGPSILVRAEIEKQYLKLTGEPLQALVWNSKQVPGQKVVLLTSAANREIVEVKKVPDSTLKCNTLAKDLRWG